MNALVVANLVLLLGGATFLVMAYRERSRELPWFGFRWSNIKGGIRNRFTTRGFKYYLTGSTMMVLGGLAGFVYWSLR